MTVILKRVCKSINNVPILRDIDLTINSGEIVGIMGRNGSGKSMLFKAICGLITIDSGMILIDGKKATDTGCIDDLGALIEQPGFIPELCGLDNLLALASIRRRTTRREIIGLMRQLDLQPEDRRPCRKYSLGMQQKLGIIAAVMEKPSTILLDEPCNNLDNDGVYAVRNLVSQLNIEDGTTIIIASHNPDDFTSKCSKCLTICGGSVKEEIS